MTNKSLALSAMRTCREQIPGLHCEVPSIGPSLDGHTESTSTQNMLVTDLAAYYQQYRAGCDPDDVLKDWF